MKQTNINIGDITLLGAPSGSGKSSLLFNKDELRIALVIGNNFQFIDEFNLEFEDICNLTKKIYNQWLKEFDDLPSYEQGYIQEYAMRIYNREFVRNYITNN